MILLPGLAAQVIAGPRTIEPRRLLILSTQVAGWSGHQAFERALHANLEALWPGQIEYYHEYIDAERLAEPVAEAASRDFLSVKYATMPPDLVVTFGPAAYTFMVHNYDELFPRAPVIYSLNAGTQPVPHHPSFTGVADTLDLTRSLELAFLLQPETERVFVVSGTAAADRDLEALARRQFRPYERGRTMHFLSGMRMDQLEPLLAGLPDRSLVFYLRLSRDGAGQTFTPTEAFARVASRASVPVYCASEAFLGRGCVATRSADLEQVAQLAAGMVARALRGEHAAAIDAVQAQSDRAVIDWRLLRRWDIRASRVPPGSVLLHRRPSAWSQYRGEFMALVVVLALQAVFILALIWQRIRRRQAERLAMRADAELRASHDRIQELARRLITAQEAERTRVAHELHDDVNQVVAALSIRLSELRQDLPANHTELRSKVDWLQQRASTLVEMIRAMSHELHPGVLQHMGLVAALRSACAEVAAPHGIAVQFYAVQPVIDVPDDVGLALYRITQEAIHNVVRHAQAKHVQVRLLDNEFEVRLEIIDDGRGFRPDQGNPAGLGLLSMRERVALLRGRLFIDSLPGSGTRIVVRVPRRHFQTGDGEAEFRFKPATAFR